MRCRFPTTNARTGWRASAAVARISPATPSGTTGFVYISTRRPRRAISPRKSAQSPGPMGQNIGQPRLYGVNKPVTILRFFCPLIAWLNLECFFPQSLDVGGATAQHFLNAAMEHVNATTALVRFFIWLLFFSKKILKVFFLFFF